MCDDLDFFKTQTKITSSVELPHTLFEVREEFDFVAAARVKENLCQLGEPKHAKEKLAWYIEKKVKTKKMMMGDFTAYLESH